MSNYDNLAYEEPVQLCCALCDWAATAPGVDEIICSRGYDYDVDGLEGALARMHRGDEDACRWFEAYDPVNLWPKP